MWRNALAGNRDMYLARSMDGGRTFGPAEKLGRLGWELNACPMDGGAIAPVAEGRVDTVWMRAGSIFAARAGDPGASVGSGPGCRRGPRRGPTACTPPGWRPAPAA